MGLGLIGRIKEHAEGENRLFLKRLGEAMLTVEEAQKLASEGARRLDEKEPFWYGMVDIPTLDMASGVHCVLGQVYGLYGEGTEVLDLTVGQSEALGFTLDMDRLGERLHPLALRDRVERENWLMLRLAWVNEIAWRQQAERDRLAIKEASDSGRLEPKEAAYLLDQAGEGGEASES